MPSWRQEIIELQYIITEAVFMNVLVVGCGKVGSRLARLLAQRGHND